MNWVSVCVRTTSVYAPAILFLSLLTPASAQDVLGDAFKRFDVLKESVKAKEQNPSAPRDGSSPRNNQPSAQLAAEPERGEKKLDKFYEEMEALVTGKDDFAKIVKKLKAELESEFRENETVLLSSEVDPPEKSDEVQELEDRQKVIAQLYAELSLRTSQGDSRKQFEIHREIRNRFRAFRNENPKLANTDEFRRKEQELTQRAMRNRMMFGRQNGPSMSETYRKLSANSDQLSIAESSHVHPGEQDGAIQALRPGLRRLLKLTWEGANLKIDRQHWDNAFAGRTLEDIRIELNDLLEDAGAKTTGESEDVLRMRQMAARHPSHQQPNVARLFEELRGGGMYSGGYSRSGSGDSVQRTFSNNQVSARLKTSKSQFQLRIEEETSPGRVIRIMDDKNTLRILLVGDLIHLFQIDENGVSVVEIMDNDVVSHRDKTFADFYRAHPRFVEERLFALFDHLGIVPPASRFDPAIVRRVVEYLRMDRDKLRHEVDELLKDLDADRFTKREAAYRQLQDRIEEYYDLLHGRASADELSAEVYARVKKLLAVGELAPASYHDNVISALGLTGDLEYLQEVRDVVDTQSQQVLDKRIASLLVK